MKRVLFLLFPVLHANTVISTCQFNYEVDCENPYLANARVTFIDPNYMASVTFHWDTVNTFLGYQEYSSNSQTYVGDFFNFGAVGEYTVGATVTFGEGSNCNGEIIRRNHTVWFGDSACGLIGVDDEMTTVPSSSPAINVATTPRPTPSEIDRTTTYHPSSSETNAMISPAPTSKSPVSTSLPTQKPSSVPTQRPTNMLVPVTPSPSDNVLATIAPSLLINNSISPISKVVTSREYNVASRMVLFYMESMDDKSQQSWLDVTKKTIHREVVSMVGIEPKNVEIDVTLDSLRTIALSRIRTLRSIKYPYYEAGWTVRRRQQSLSPIEIQFNTSIQFPSESDDWDGAEMVAAAFQTQKEQTKYIVDLKIEDMDYFWSVERFTMEVEGNLVTEPSIVVEKGNGSVYFVVALVVGGLILVVFALGTGVYCVKRKGRNNLKGVRADLKSHHNDPDRVGLEIETKSDTLNHPQSYFGTIQSKDESSDDISTLGDPFMGDAIPSIMDTDNTVGESMVSSQQQLYMYGVGRSQLSCVESRMGDMTLNSGVSKVMIFGEDITLEDIYQSPSGSSDTPLDLITVMAPSGPLGIVLDNPLGSLPVIYAIRETSSLAGKVRVGDLLVSVDEIDCRGMSSHNISRFLNDRSNAPQRTLVLARCSGMSGLVTAESV